MRLVWNGVLRSEGAVGEDEVVGYGNDRGLGSTAILTSTAHLMWLSRFQMEVSQDEFARYFQMLVEARALADDFSFVLVDVDCVVNTVFVLWVGATFFHSYTKPAYHTPQEHRDERERRDTRRAAADGNPHILNRLNRDEIADPVEPGTPWPYEYTFDRHPNHVLVWDYPS